MRWMSALLLAAAALPGLDFTVKDEPLAIGLERLSEDLDVDLLVAGNAQKEISTVRNIRIRSTDLPTLTDYLTRETGVTIQVQDGCLRVEAATEALARRLVRKTYDLRGLLSIADSHPGPWFDVPEPGGKGATLMPPNESGRRIVLPVDLLKRELGPLIDAAGAGVELNDERLIVTAPPEADAIVATFLQRLEAAAVRQVTLLGWRLDHAPAPGPLLDAPAFAALQPQLGPPTVAWICRDGQQNHVASLDNRAYVADLDVVQQREDPVVSILTSGMSLDTSPALVADGTELHLRLEVAQEGTTTTKTSTDATGKCLATWTMPSLTVDHASVDLLVPTGGAAVAKVAGAWWVIQPVALR